MKLSDLYSKLEEEFEIDIPEEAEETMVCVRDIRDYIREACRLQGIEMPAGAIFERVRRAIAVWAKVDAMSIQPQTKLVDIMPQSDTLIWG
jgi:hypothetical protein